MYRRSVLPLAGLLLIILAACSAAPSTTTGTPAEVQALQQYIQALVDKDESAYSQLICPNWEMEAFLEFDAYKGVKSEVGAMTCRRVGGQDGSATVNCQGKISLNYGNEKQEVDLSSRNYRLTSNGQSWQVCGFSDSAQ